MRPKFFNFCMIGTGFRVDSNSEIQIRVILKEYTEKTYNLDGKVIHEEKKTGIYFPGGDAQVIDFCKALEIVMEKQMPDKLTTQLLKDLQNINSRCENDSANRRIKNVDYLMEAETVILKAFPMEGGKLPVIVKEILEISKRVTLGREIFAETLCQFASFTEVSNQPMPDLHVKYVNLINDLQGPERVDGTGEKEVLSSWWMEANEVKAKLCPKHERYRMPLYVKLHDHFMAEKQHVLARKISSFIY
ncbi:MAG: hypothetical protein US50_C0028G0009 [Candidatus Nomurabacteria bacterium GW2011_GWB1_37_5]|uniref:Nudix hydrolase domain-containing protein n=1 Tax=Candidatus Nomurabacteria bacterium GW2011_GWB1_37_5 TaxID=1618742 RepID=A0A0G0H908_9BACT|nr:MAG: hypothetical protein US50_C0028G0009 [Candidatus Nomurabacteria bacterium GW2011_GWB1_37_5]